SNFIHLFTYSIYFCVYIFLSIATPTPEIYTLSLHDALPISITKLLSENGFQVERIMRIGKVASVALILNRLSRYFGFLRHIEGRSEEHTSELQSHLNLVCRLLLEKKKI